MKIVLSVVALILIGTAGVLFFGTDRTSKSEGDLLPNETFIHSNGDSVDLHSLIEGAPAIINSWATWCPFCVNELPDMARLQNELGSEVLIVAINRGESIEKAQPYIAELGAEDVTYLYDTDDSWYSTIGGFSMPETLFVNKSGEIMFHKRGVLSYEELKTLTNTYLRNN